MPILCRSARFGAWTGNSSRSGEQKALSRNVARRFHVFLLSHQNVTTEKVQKPPPPPNPSFSILPHLNTSIHQPTHYKQQTNSNVSSNRHPPHRKKGSPPFLLGKNTHSHLHGSSFSCPPANPHPRPPPPPPKIPTTKDPIRHRKAFLHD